MGYYLPLRKNKLNKYQKKNTCRSKGGGYIGDSIKFTPPPNSEYSLYTSVRGKEGRHIEREEFYLFLPEKSK